MIPATTVPVSVALCTRNGATFIREQLLSILTQDDVPDEIVLSDDASSDDTVEIAQEVFASWKDRHPGALVSLAVIRNPAPLGVTANFESAITRCRGELIALSDQDDVWHADRISLARALFDADADLDLLFTDARLVDAAGAPLGVTLFDTLELGEPERRRIADGDSFDVFITRNVATGATMMFRRRLLESSQPFPETWVHDEWLAAIAAALGSARLLDSPLIDYRQHGSNEIGVTRPTLRRKIARVLQARGDRNDRLARNFGILRDRLSDLGSAVSQEVQQKAVTKATVEEFRAALPDFPLARVPGVLTAARKGWYRDYCSQGSLDIVRDLLQPHTAG